MKPTFPWLLALPVFILLFSCTKERVNPAATAIASSDLKSDYYIGQPYGGGIIFYIDATGIHGLIAAPADLEEAAIWAYKDTVIGVKARKIGAGHKNTLNIFKALGDPGSPELDYAALDCAEFKFKGYNDWYLPSKDEMNELYKQQDIVGGFNPFSYWTSTEFDISTAWFQNFSNGKQIKATKIAAYGMRPVRSF